MLGAGHFCLLFALFGIAFSDRFRGLIASVAAAMMTSTSIVSASLAFVVGLGASGAGLRVARNRRSPYSYGVVADPGHHTSRAYVRAAS